MRASERVTLLVVDDELLLRLIAADLFEDHGFEVVLAENAEQGLKLLKNRPEIAALITDIELPGGYNGYRLAEEARISRPELVVIFVSGKAEPKSADLPYGYRFIRKPFDPEHLLYAVKQLLELKLFD
jgi:DNA-binding NtrC family response regulator